LSTAGLEIVPPGFYSVIAAFGFCSQRRAVSPSHEQCEISLEKMQIIFGIRASGLIKANESEGAANYHLPRARTERLHSPFSRLQAP
jgi:hypothetical protein